MKEEKQIEYQFTAVPTTLFLLLDNNCRSMLFTLIQLSTMYSNSDRYFYRSNEDLQSQSNLSKNLVIATIDTLYINKIVDVKTVGKSKGKYTNEYKLNFDKIKEYDKLSIEDTKNPSNKIAIVDYKNNYQPQYIKDYLIENEEDNNECKEPRKRTRKEARKRVRKEPRKKVNTNIDNIESLENKDNIYNIKDNIYSNIYSIKYNKEKSKIEDTTNVEVANEVANAKTSFNNNIENKADIPTLVEKTTDTSTDEISSNTELKNNADADTSIEEPFDIEKAIKNNMEFQRYYTNINVAFTKRSVATLKLYEKMFSSNVEYLSNREIEELKNLASDAKRKLQLELGIAA